MSRLMTAYRAFGLVKSAGVLVSGISIFLLMLFIVVDVVRRNFLDESIPGGFEIAQNYFLPLSVFPSLGYVYASGILPKMDLLMPKLGMRLQSGVIYVLLCLEIVIFALLVFYTWDFASVGYERRTAFPAGGTLYPLWPLLFLVPFGFALVLIETVFVLLRNVLEPRPAALGMVRPEDVPRLDSGAPADPT